MRNYLFLCFLFSVSVSYADNSFEPLQYQVGEEIIKPLIQSDANFSSVNFTTKSILNIIPIASGVNVLPQIIDSLNLILKKAVQNTSVTTGEQTGIIITGAMLSNGITVAGIAQSGVFIQRLLNSLDYSGNALLLLSSKKEGDSIFQTLFNSASFSILSWSQLTEMTVRLNTSISVLNITSLSQEDLERRQNQFKAISREGCSEGVSLGQTYCMDVRPYFKFFLGLPGRSNDLYSSKEPVPFSTWRSEIENILIENYAAGVEVKFKYSDDCPNCFPINVYAVDVSTQSPVSPSFSISYRSFENPNSKCPKGLVFDHSFTANSTIGYGQSCVPNYDYDDVSPFYNSFNYRISFPHFELYPDGAIKLHPGVFLLTKYYDLNIISDNSSLSYTKHLASNVVVNIAVKPLVSENAILISKTISGLTLLRSGNIETALVIREITKFSNDFKLKERSYSFFTQDGFDIAVQNTYLSPKTYGIMGKTIAEQFSIKTIDTITPTGESKPVDTITPTTSTGDSNSPIVPCGLNKDVQVLKMSNNQYYFETQNSPPCDVDWGEAPEHPKVKGESSEEQTEEQVEKELSDQLKQFFTDFKGNFGDSKGIFPVTEQCPPFEIDFTNAPMLKGKKFSFNQHCEEIAKNPAIQSTIRFVSMIVWFSIALIRVLRA